MKNNTNRTKSADKKPKRRNYNQPVRYWVGGGSGQLDMGNGCRMAINRIPD